MVSHHVLGCWKKALLGNVRLCQISSSYTCIALTKPFASHFMLDCKRSLIWIFSFLHLCKNNLELRDRELVGTLNCFYPCRVSLWQLCKWAVIEPTVLVVFFDCFWLCFCVCACFWFLLLLFGLWVGFYLLSFFVVVLLTDLKMRLMKRTMISSALCLHLHHRTQGHLPGPPSECTHCCAPD